MMQRFEAICHRPTIPPAAALGRRSAFNVCVEMTVAETTGVTCLWSAQEWNFTSRGPKINWTVSQSMQGNSFILMFSKGPILCLRLSLSPSSPDEWDIHSSAVRINGRRRHQSLLAHPREFSTAFCLFAAAAQSFSSARTRLSSPITSGFWLSSTHKGRATSESWEKSFALSQRTKNSIWWHFLRCISPSNTSVDSS